MKKPDANNAEILPEVGALLDRRYGRMLEVFCPFAYGHYKGFGRHEVRSAVMGLDAFSPSIFHLFEVFLGDRRKRIPNEEQAQQLVFLLLTIRRYLSMRGWREISLRWGLDLYRLCQVNGWSFDPALIGHISKAYKEQNDNEEAITFIRQILTDDTTKANSRLETALYISLSGAYFHQKQFDLALASASRALEMSPKSDEHEVPSAAYAHLFDIFVALGRRKDALEAAKAAMHHAVQTGDPIWVAECTLKLAMGYTANHDFEQALPLYKAALDFFTGLEDEPNTARVKFCFAVHWKLAGNDPEAERLARESLAIFRRYMMHTDLEQAKALLRTLSSA